MTSNRYHNHIILCEWNHRTKEIVNDLRADGKTALQPLVLIADIPTKPIDDDNFHFVAGNVTDETLQRANIAQAQTVVILGDDRLEPTARDAKVVLATLTVESINRDVYTIVELVSDANVRHCERASANEIIVNNHVTSGLLARAVLDHGITKVISEWLSVDHGNELYKIHVPTTMVNRSFVEVLGLMKQQHGCIVLGIQSGVQSSGIQSNGNSTGNNNGNNEVLSNPPTDYIVGKDDQLIVVCAERPNIL